MSDLNTLASKITSSAAARTITTAQNDALRVAAVAARRSGDQTPEARTVLQAVAWLAQAAREDVEGAKCPYCGAGGWDLTCWFCGGR